MSYKLSMLFWCGLFVAGLGSYLLITNLFTLLVIFSLASSPYANLSFGLIIARAALFVGLYTLLVVAGVYVMKKGITRVQPPPVEPVASEPVT